MEAASVSASSLIRVAALSGSLRKSSYNRGLIRSAIEISKTSINGLQIEYIDISPLPLLNTDLEGKGSFPPAIEAFRQKILEADSILFASPEYNYSFTAPLKNAIDWASRPPNVWADKAAAIVSAGGDFGGGRSQYHLRQVGVFLDLHFINKPEFFLNAFQPPTKFDSDGNLIDEQAKERLKEVLLSLQAFSLKLHQNQ
ncbi:PREDICTED: NADPH [Prunus dulcis]|uniref:NAD(P)H dehydrogenase (quinone) n=1 Tax=Prunus dulcis TaxID=3755 RepID=A0A5E4FPZ2_PRUDU|nr:NADPH:quinone oxidoreductase-like [Prunus dulcis]VVA29544.1 PREDICTED: NADPH [Prunus dulcis]